MKKIRRIEFKWKTMSFYMAISVRFDLYKTMYSIAIIDTCCHEQSLQIYTFLYLILSLLRCTFFFFLSSIWDFFFMNTAETWRRQGIIRITQMYKYVARIWFTNGDRLCGCFWMRMKYTILMRYAIAYISICPYTYRYICVFYSAFCFMHIAWITESGLSLCAKFFVCKKKLNNVTISFGVFSWFIIPFC